MSASITQQGALNTTALVVSGLYVQIVPPQTLFLNGVPTNVLGVVGTASWGPVNQPTICSAPADYAAAFGPVMARKYDLGTAVNIASAQGATNFRCVRVTDGTDIAATVTLSGSAGNTITLTAIHTGSLGNQMQAILSAGSAANTTKLVIALPGVTPEVYDNISGTGAALWTALVSAVNNGQSALRGPSQLAVAATIGTGSSTAPVNQTYNFAGGTDGATTITSAALIGVDTTPREGMYALRGQGCGVGLLADADDSTQWTNQVAFGLSEGVYMVASGPVGDTISNAVSVKATAGIDSYTLKLMFGDWIYWYDQTNKVTRLVSPAAFAAGKLAALSPEQSSLNKQLMGIIGTQKSGYAQAQNTTYSNAELQTLFQAGIDVIANPSPGGAYFAVRQGCNTSSNPAVNGDNYTRMTNYIATTLGAGMGIYVGDVMTPDLFGNVRGTQLAFLNAMLGQGMLVSYGGVLPYAVQCDDPSVKGTNNPQSRVALGYLQSDCQVQYAAINQKFIVNFQGGQTVQVTLGATTPVAG
jgi:hypothetical protein